MAEIPLQVEITEAAQLAQTGALILDVREPHEWAHGHVANAVHVPMGEIPGRLAELPRNQQILVMCHHGGRSLRVTQYLRAQGLASVSNIDGGIDAWSSMIDPSLPRY